MKRNILDYEVESKAVIDCVDEITQAIDLKQYGCEWLACINPHSYVVARSDNVYAAALRSARWLIPDGVGITVAGRILGRPLQSRITGSDIFYGVMTNLDTAGKSVFFLGSTEYTLDLISKKLAVDYPNIRLAGTYSPPFKDEYSQDEIDAMIEHVNISKADVLWVGLTAPKQEKWIYANCEKLEVPFAGAIGAVFDFYTD